MPGPSLQGGIGGGPLQQGGDQLRQRLAIGSIEAGRQQQWRFAGEGGHGFTSLESLQGRHITLHLLFLLQQVLHQFTVAVAGLEPAQQQLAEGAQGGQGIAQLMHEHAQLVLLVLEGMVQPLALQIETEGLGEAQHCGLQPVVEIGGPGQGPGFHLDGPQQDALVPQGQPAALLGRDAQRAVSPYGWQCPAAARPLPHRHQGWGGAIARFGQVDHKGLQILAVAELIELALHQSQKPLGHLHQGVSADPVPLNFGNGEKIREKVLRFLVSTTTTLPGHQAVGRRRGANHGVESCQFVQLKLQQEWAPVQVPCVPGPGDGNAISSAGTLTTAHSASVWADGGTVASSAPRLHWRSGLMLLNGRPMASRSAPGGDRQPFVTPSPFSSSGLPGISSMSKKRKRISRRRLAGQRVLAHVPTFNLETGSHKPVTAARRYIAEEALVPPAILNVRRNEHTTDRFFWGEKGLFSAQYAEENHFLFPSLRAIVDRIGEDVLFEGIEALAADDWEEMEEYEYAFV